MVSGRLNRLLSKVSSLTRRSRTGPLLVGTSTLAVVLSLVGFIHQKTNEPIARQPSLLDLLEEVGRDRPQSTNLQGDAPQPPEATAWVSPLRQQCSNIDASVQQRLQTQRSQLAQLRRSVPADDSNFGDRWRSNPWGEKLNPVPRVVVLHETVYSLNSALNTFLTPHPRDEDQVSYHTLVGLDGSIVDVVDPLKRAYGAGYSAFHGEWAVTNAEFQGSVNNFALHLSLETPGDGQNSSGRHSGYTPRQYDALALVLDNWLERFQFPASAITTHRHVDLGGERGDPRSFSWDELQVRLAALGKLCDG